MRIAVVSTVFKSTPPRGYGGIERVVHTFVEELIAEGHDVHLFATPGSYCSGATITIPDYDPLSAPSGIRNESERISEEPLYEVMKRYLDKHPVDIIHDWSFQNLYVRRHPEKFPYIVSICIPPLPGYTQPNLVASSKAHALLCGGATKFVRYGLDFKKYSYKYSKKEHCIHISKIAKIKGQHLAIKAFRKAQKPLVIAGNVEDKLYYYSVIKPLIWISPLISYIGETDGTNSYLCDASALIQTPFWFDAFPLVILEAFAAGTPVIALSRGGIPEQIKDGVNGFLCGSVDDLISAVERISEIKPQDCRSYGEEYFSVNRMVRNYVDLYHRVLNGESW